MMVMAVRIMLMMMMMMMVMLVKWVMIMIFAKGMFFFKKKILFKVNAYRITIQEA